MNEKNKQNACAIKLNVISLQRKIKTSNNNLKFKEKNENKNIHNQK